MNRIQEIIRLESEAALPEGEASLRRWQVARLMWEEVQTGKSRNELAEEVGKSRKHVQWMVKSWEVVGQHIPTGGVFPPFNPVYHGPEVRGESVVRDDSAMPRSGVRKEPKDFSQGTPKDEQAQEKSWPAAIAEAADMLQRFPAFWDMIGESELEGLDRARYTIEEILSARNR